MAAPRTLVVDVLKESAVDTVTVYSDRAEVVRLFKNLKLQEGQTEIAINGVVDLVQDSIRQVDQSKFHVVFAVLTPL
ncbi:hypothetical protein M427DRAFT_407318 [Gonapodya prolifera JEL478]|uniref:DUF4140 domain-containing protein n=1 Tax=Gonapodya prolifera (strain JEL478) TaxID=1344416 RepID=A0A139AUB0_GONPJ|nr:hypothetical protein M427DRAFT_407318 [Gonapodya prolifera JEL478]|eukprot:KXS20322.1 hypothetical protein M427DRAFT_407318 [Gonapodya prolifera JEL478]